MSRASLCRSFAGPRSTGWSVPILVSFVSNPHGGVPWSASGWSPMDGVSPMECVRSRAEVCSQNISHRILKSNQDVADHTRTLPTVETREGPQPYTLYPIPYTLYPIPF